MAEGHLQVALDRIRPTVLASADPDEFIDASWINAFGLLAEDLWRSGGDLVDDLFRLRWGIDLAPREYLLNLAAPAIEEARESYLSLLRSLINKHAFEPDPRKPLVIGEFNVGNTVQYGDVRGLLARLGGGSTAPEVSLVGGVTTGMTMKEYLGDSGVNTNQKIWLYGWEEDPRRTFNGHLQMDGLVFEDWDDEGLIIAPQDRWLRRNYYAPGDHWGCACVVAPYFPNFGDPFMI